MEVNNSLSTSDTLSKRTPLLGHEDNDTSKHHEQYYGKHREYDSNNNNNTSTSCSTTTTELPTTTSPKTIKKFIDETISPLGTGDASRENGKQIHQRLTPPTPNSPSSPACLAAQFYGEEYQQLAQLENEKTASSSANASASQKNNINSTINSNITINNNNISDDSEVEKFLLTSPLADASPDFKPTENDQGQTNNILTGRKAARTLRLFRETDDEDEGGSENGTGVSGDDANEAKFAGLPSPLKDRLLDIEPVSSATYIPHTPVIHDHTYEGPHQHQHHKHSHTHTHPHLHSHQQQHQQQQQQQNQQQHQQQQQLQQQQHQQHTSPCKSIFVAPDEVEEPVTPGLPPKPQHLTANLEFDHTLNGDITRISKFPSESTTGDASDDRRREIEEIEKIIKYSRSSTPANFLERDVAHVDDAVHTRDDVCNDLNQSGIIDDQHNFNHLYDSHKEDHFAFPLAVELRPFKNKVGGHTAIFSFSKQAVCKALVNRENIFYETIEVLHSELLSFMPKYIGVLNVRYSSIINEKELVKEEEGKENIKNSKVKSKDLVESERGMNQLEETSEKAEDIKKMGKMQRTGNMQNVDEANNADNELESTEHCGQPGTDDYRIDQSHIYHHQHQNQHLHQHLHQRGQSQTYQPEVVLDDNKHIIPDTLWKHYSSSFPSPKYNHSITSSKISPIPSLTNSPVQRPNQGSTVVNTDLQVQVLQEVFQPSLRLLDDDFFPMEEDSKDEALLVTPNASSNEQHDEQLPTLTPNSPEAILRKHTRFERFILLEDLTSNMKKPCVLDLKMGTRQYGIEANPKKQKSQRRKCLATTSRQLGVRVCGLQIFTHDNRRIARDKYFGRRLRAGIQFCKVMAKFLYNGKDVYSILLRIPHLIVQFQELYNIFDKLPGYRMYGSLILLMYEGGSKSNYDQVKVKIIDFAQSVISEEGQDHATIPPAHPHSVDFGYLRGLHSLVKYCTLIFQVLSRTKLCDLQSMKDWLVEHKDDLLVIENCVWLDDYAEIDQKVDGGINEIAEEDPFNINYSLDVEGHEEVDDDNVSE